MSEINFGLLQPVDVGALTSQGFATGMAMVKHVQTQSALKAYLANPDNPQAYNALAAYDPATAATIQLQRQNQLKYNTEVQNLATRKQVGSLAASGDISGAKAAAASSGDFDLVNTLNKMGEDERKQTTDRYTGTAPIAYQAAKLPYEQRRAFIQSATPELKALGWTDGQLAGFDPTDANLAAIVGTGSKLSELVAADKPQLVPYVPGGGVAAYQNGKLTTLIAPNPGTAAAGTPVGSSGSNGPAKNNPGALRKPGSTEFQSFATPGEGIARQEGLLGRYMGRGLNTVQSIVEHYAPRQSAGGDNTDEQVNNYIGYVSRRLGVNPQDTLSPVMVPRLAAAMREFETGRRQTASSGPDTTKIRADALEAIALGADPDQVRARAKAQGVDL